MSQYSSVSNVLAGSRVPDIDRIVSGSEPCWSWLDVNAVRRELDALVSGRSVHLDSAGLLAGWLYASALTADEGDVVDLAETIDTADVLAHVSALETVFAQVRAEPVEGVVRGLAFYIHLDDDVVTPVIRGVHDLLAAALVREVRGVPDTDVVIEDSAVELLIRVLPVVAEFVLTIDGSNDDTVVALGELVDHLLTVSEDPAALDEDD